MKVDNKLSENNLIEFKIDRTEAITLIKHFGCQYKGQGHYELIEHKCAMSVNSTVNTIIGSARYLEGYSLMPDEIHVERLAAWFINNKNYEIPHHVLIFYMAHFLKRKINEYYKAINNGWLIFSPSIADSKEALRERKKQFEIRKDIGVKRIRC